MYNVHVAVVQNIKNTTPGKLIPWGVFCLINCSNASFIPQVGHILVLLSILEIADSMLLPETLFKISVEISSK